MNADQSTRTWLDIFSNAEMEVEIGDDRDGRIEKCLWHTLRLLHPRLVEKVWNSDLHDIFHFEWNDRRFIVFWQWHSGFFIYGDKPAVEAVLTKYSELLAGATKDPQDAPSPLQSDS